MKKTRLIRTVRAQLDRSTAQLDPQVTERLFLARQAALGHQRVRSSRLAGIGAHFDLEDGPGPLVARIVAVLLLVGGLAYWHAQNHIAELEEVDSEILIDELPLDAYTDKGFDTWLRRSDAQ